MQYLIFILSFVDEFPSLQCHFCEAQLTNDKFNLESVCRPSATFSSIVPSLISEKSEIIFENGIGGTFSVSRQQLLLSLSHDAAKLSPATQCFQGLEFCPFGVTVVFLLAVHQRSPASSSSSSGSQSWRIFDLHGETNSSLSITLEKSA